MEYQMEGIDAFCILLPYYCIWKNNSQKERRSGLESGRNGVDPSLSLSLSLFLYFFVYLVHWSICPDSDDVFVLFFWLPNGLLPLEQIDSDNKNESVLSHPDSTLASFDESHILVGPRSIVFICYTCYWKRNVNDGTPLSPPPHFWLFWLNVPMGKSIISILCVSFLYPPFNSIDFPSLIGGLIVS